MDNKQLQKIKKIWDDYVAGGKSVPSINGEDYQNIDDSRVEAIVIIKELIESFRSKKTSVYEFKTSLDSFNKKNNFWGFTATKGQMFFNQLVKNEDEISLVVDLLIKVINEPKNLEDAVAKIAELEEYCKPKFDAANDKRKVANPGSICYFLSYFWQIQSHQKWPIMYTSLINVFEEFELWESFSSQSKSYKFFYELNEKIKSELSDYSESTVSNWDAEHAFWYYKQLKINKEATKPKVKKTPVLALSSEVEDRVLTASFSLKDYLVPKVANLIELGASKTLSSVKKGSEYEKLVAEIFKMLDFEVEFLGQGTGRNPDAILRFREENIAFIVDAKAYENGYSMGVDDRAMREYIFTKCPELQKEGYKKIGFIIVSNSFKSNFDSFANDITWSTDIRRFILLSSEALLYMLAFKIKDRISLNDVVSCLVEGSNPIEASNIIEKFDDV